PTTSHTFGLGPDRAAVGAAEIGDAAVAEEDFAGVDIEEETGVGNEAFHVLVSIDPNLLTGGHVATGGLSPSAQDLGLGHADVGLLFGELGFFRLDRRCHPSLA